MKLTHLSFPWWFGSSLEQLKPKQPQYPDGFDLPIIDIHDLTSDYIDFQSQIEKAGICEGHPVNSLIDHDLGWDYTHLKKQVTLVRNDFETLEKDIQTFRNEHAADLEVVDSPAQYLISPKKVPSCLRLLFCFLLFISLFVSWTSVIAASSPIVQLAIIPAILAIIVIFENVSSEYAWDVEQKKQLVQSRSRIIKAERNFWLISVILVLFIPISAILGEFVRLRLQQGTFSIANLSCPAIGFILAIIWISIVRMFAVKHGVEFATYVAQNRELPHEMSSKVKSAQDKCKTRKAKIEALEQENYARKRWLQEHSHKLDDMCKQIMDDILKKVSALKQST